VNFFPKCPRLFQAIFLITGILITQSVDAQLAPPTGASYGGSVPGSSKVVTGIAWYGVLNDGLAEAKRTGKPILLITSAAQCGGVPGMW